MLVLALLFALLGGLGRGLAPYAVGSAYLFLPVSPGSATLVRAHNLICARWAHDEASTMAIRSAHENNS